MEITRDNTNSVPHYFFALAGNVMAAPIEDVPEQEQQDTTPADCCDDCLVLPALAESGLMTDPLKNDFYTVMYRASTFTAATITLEVYEDCEEWATVAVLNEDDTYGTYHAPSVITLRMKKYAVSGFTLNWNQVLTLLGTGHYRIKGVVSGKGGGTYYTLPFKLRPWSVYAADGTVRFDWSYKGVQADMWRYGLRTDYGSTGIGTSLRVRGRFGKMRLAYEPTDRDLNTGKTERVRIDITPSYVFNSDRFYYTVHELLGFNAFIADDLTVTDFAERTQYYDIVRLPVRVSSGYEPVYQHALRKIFQVAVEFEHKSWDLGRGTDNC